MGWRRGFRRPAYRLAPSGGSLIAYGASIGGIGTLVGTPPNIIFVKIAHDVAPDQEISFLEWMFAAMPFVIVLLPLTWLMMVRILFPLPPEGMEWAREIIERERQKQGPMSKGESRTLIVFVTTAILWITREGIDAGGVNIPGWIALFPNPHYIKDSTVAIFMGILLFLIPVNLKKAVFLLDLEWALKSTTGAKQWEDPRELDDLVSRLGGNSIFWP